MDQAIKEISFAEFTAILSDPSDNAPIDILTHNDGLKEIPDGKYKGLYRVAPPVVEELTIGEFADHDPAVGKLIDECVETGKPFFAPEAIAAATVEEPVPATPTPVEPNYAFPKFYNSIASLLAKVIRTDEHGHCVIAIEDKDEFLAAGWGFAGTYSKDLTLFARMTPPNAEWTFYL